MKLARLLRRPSLIALAAVAVVLPTIVAAPAASAAAAKVGPQFPLKATVYDAVTNEPVNLVGRIKVTIDTNGSTASMTSSLDTVTGRGATSGRVYTATGASKNTAQLPPGPPTRTASFTPSFVLHPPSPIKPQAIVLGIIATWNDRGELTGIEVRSPAPPVLFNTDATVRPEQTSVLGDPSRPLVRLADALGNSTDFVANELTVSTNDATELAGIVGRWNGQVLRSIAPPAGSSVPTLHVVHVDPSNADLSVLKANVMALDPTAHGAHKFTSAGALKLFAAAVAETKAGHRVGINTTHQPNDYVSGVVTEAPGGVPDWGSSTPYTSNAAAWSYMKAGGPENFGVSEAWRMLAVGGALGNHVKIGIIDGGCDTSNPDFPPDTSGGNGVRAASGADPWHCTNVALTAGGVPDNNVGVAGTGGPVADLRLYTTDMTDDNAASKVYAAAGDGVKIINMSFGGDQPAINELLDNGFENATQSARYDWNILVFAAAGNDTSSTGGKVSQDVDHQTCYIVCVEEAFVKPCEFNGVLCVGGLKSGSRNRDPGSYYCLERRGEGICDVDLYAPFAVYRGVQNGGAVTDWATKTQGTSFSSPYAAGVAALIWAADPSLSATAIEAIMTNVTLPSSDPSVTSVVDAKFGVKRGFGGNVPPSIRITSPTAATPIYYGGANAVHFSAETLDIEDGVNNDRVRWTSDVDGPLSSDYSFDYVFPTPGPRRITATVLDAQVKTTSTSIDINALNYPPHVAIVWPYNGAELHTDVTYHFVGEVEDQINTPDPSLCPDIVWTSDYFQDAPFPTTGCSPAINFNDAGARTITATYTDEQGDTATRSIDIYVSTPPPNSPPTVVIDSPGFGFSVEEGHIIQLRGSVYLEPDDDPSLVEYGWYLNGVLICECLNYDFGPSDPAYVVGSDMTLSFFAHDDDPGFGTDVRYIRIAAKPK